MDFKHSIIALFSILLVSCQTKKQETTVQQATTEKIQPAINDLPNLKVEDVNGSILQLQDLSGEIAIIFFNPDCDHCENQARFIQAKKDLFKGKQLYFVSAAGKAEINGFIARFSMNEPNYHFSHANPGEVINSVGTFSAMPTIFIYKEKKRIAKFDGTTPAEDIANVFTVK
jgi:hypothetical protein